MRELGRPGPLALGAVVSDAGVQADSGGATITSRMGSSIRMLVEKAHSHVHDGIKKVVRGAGRVGAHQDPRVLLLADLGIWSSASTSTAM